MVYNEALFKLIELTNGKPELFVKIDNEWKRIIPESEFSSEEIEELRDLEKWRQENGNPPMIANFLPDDIRPAHVKKL